jgi:hypothetical protein
MRQGCCRSTHPAFYITSRMTTTVLLQLYGVRGHGRDFFLADQ